MTSISHVEEITTHSRAIEKEKENFSSDWVVMTEVYYKGYRFDVFALNPITKKIKVVEVDLTCNTSKEKIALIESFAELKIIKPQQKRRLNKTKSFRFVMKAVANNIRVALLDYLNIEGGKTYSELIQSVCMAAHRDGGRFSYHLNYLLKTSLIKQEGKIYVITEKGEKILAFFNTLE